MSNFADLAWIGLIKSGDGEWQWLDKTDTCVRGDDTSCLNGDPNRLKGWCGYIAMASPFEGAEADSCWNKVDYHFICETGEGWIIQYVGWYFLKNILAHVCCKIS